MLTVSTHIHQRRFAHTDLKFPDYGDYKKADKYKTGEGAREAGKLFTYVMVGGTKQHVYYSITVTSLTRRWSLYICDDNILMLTIIDQLLTSVVLGTRLICRPKDQTHSFLITTSKLLL